MVRSRFGILGAMVVLLFHQAAWSFSIFPSLGGTRSGTAAMTFLRIGVGARANALAGAYTAVCKDAFALYHNPAGIAWNEADNLAVAYRFWVADMDHSFLGITKHINENNVIGLSIVSLGTEPMPVTDEYHPTGTGETIKYADLAVGASYSTKLTDYFSSGLTLKYAHEELGDLRMGAWLVDLGTLYQTDFHGTSFAINVANFGGRMRPGGTYKYKSVTGEWIDKQYQSFSPPTVFKVAVAFDLIADESRKFTWMTQLNHPTDNAENVATGFEFGMGGWAFIRGGYLHNSRVEDFSLGGGVKLDFNLLSATLDASYTNMKDLGGTTSISLMVEF